MAQYWEQGECYKEGAYTLLCVCSQTGVFYCPQLGGVSAGSDFRPVKLEDFSVLQLASAWRVSVEYIDVLTRAFFERPGKVATDSTAAVLPVKEEEEEEVVVVFKGSWLKYGLELEFLDMLERRAYPMYA